MFSSRLWAKRRKVTVFGATASIIAVAFGPTASALDSKSLSSAATITSCSVPAPTTAAGYQTLFDIHTAKWSGADNGYSLPLPNGKVLWLFADTFTGALNPDGSRAAGAGMINNSAFLQDKGCITPMVGKDALGNVASLVRPAVADGSRYWFQNAVMDGGYLRALMSHMKPVDATNYGFQGVDLATFDVSGSVPRLVGVTSTPASVSTADMPSWGAGMVQDSTYTYIFGTATVSGKWGKAVYLARVPLGKLVTPTAWRYWNGSSWGTDVTKRVPVISADQTIDNAFSVHRLSNGTFRIVNKDYSIIGTTISAYTSKTPVGPWTKSAPIADAPVPATQSGQGVNYLAGEHPEIKLASGKVLVTSNNNSLNNNDNMVDGHLYGPRFVEVSLTR